MSNRIITAEIEEQDIVIELSGRGPKGETGNVYFPVFTFDFSNGHLIMIADNGYNGPIFQIISTTGHLEVVYNGNN